MRTIYYCTTTIVGRGRRRRGVRNWHVVVGRGRGGAGEREGAARGFAVITGGRPLLSPLYRKTRMTGSVFRFDSEMFTAHKFVVATKTAGRTHKSGKITRRARGNARFYCRCVSRHFYAVTVRVTRAARVAAPLETDGSPVGCVGGVFGFCLGEELVAPGGGGRRAFVRESRIPSEPHAPHPHGISFKLS